MSNHNYNKYYNKFENKQNRVAEPEQAAPAVTPEAIPEAAPEIVNVIPDVPGVAKVAEVTILEPEVSTEPEAPAEPEGKNGVVFNCVKLNVREKPVVGSRVVGIIDVDTKLTVTTDESFGIFYKICTASGVEGYCIKDYVRLV